MIVDRIIPLVKHLLCILLYIMSYGSLNSCSCLSQPRLTNQVQIS